MFYRIKIDLAFTDLPPPGWLQAHADSLLTSAIIINPGELNEERGYIKIEKCYHDEDPTIPCEIILNHQVPD